MSDVGVPAFVPVVDPRPNDQAWSQAVGWPIKPETTLIGNAVRLTSSDPDADAAELFAALDDDLVWAHLAGRPRDIAGMAALLASRVGDPEWHPWTVRMAHPLGELNVGAVVGLTCYLDVSTSDARGEIGSTMYAPSVWASAVNPECKLLLLQHAFEVMGWGRVQLKTDIRNHRSQAAIARLGAQYEGTLRRHHRRGDGTVRDSVFFSVLAQEWPMVRRNLVERLAAAAPPPG